MGDEESSKLHFKTQRLMKNIFLIVALLAITFSFGQEKKVKTISKKAPTAVEIKEIPYEERISTIKGDPYGDASIAVESAPIKQDEDSNTIYNYAGIEVKPEFPGGNDKFFTFFSKNFQYTDEMKEAELKGKIFISFIVEPDGSITNIKVIRGLGFGTDVEAMRIIKRMPKWNPGEQNGKKVRCSYTVPITIYATK